MGSITPSTWWKAQDIRDHNNDGFNNTIGQGKLGGDVRRIGLLRRRASPPRRAGIRPADELQLGDPDRHHPARVPAITREESHSWPPRRSPRQSDRIQVDYHQVCQCQSADLTPTGRITRSGDRSSSTGGGPIVVKGGLTIDGQGGLSVSTNSNFWVSGNLLGNTTNAAGFNPSRQRHPRQHHRHEQLAPAPGGHVAGHGNDHGRLQAELRLRHADPARAAITSSWSISRTIRRGTAPRPSMPTRSWSPPAPPSISTA